jgi:hypothetical protein
MKLNFLVLANNITKSNVEEESSPPSPKDAMTNSKKKTMNSEDITSAATP